jgi:hypothetical protein
VADFDLPIPGGFSVPAKTAPLDDRPQGTAGEVTGKTETKENKAIAA